jgi:hypothetical protein
MVKLANNKVLENSQYQCIVKRWTISRNFHPRYKGLIQGRKQLEIKQYILWNPTDTLDDIINGCELNTSKSTLRRYLEQYGMQPKVARSKIVILDVNKKKRLEFCKEMLSKTDAELNSIWFSDETIVKSHPNGEIVLYKCPPANEYFEPSNASGGKSVMFWGVISNNAYGPLVEVKGKNTASSIFFRIFPKSDCIILIWCSILTYSRVSRYFILFFPQIFRCI